MGFGGAAEFPEESIHEPAIRKAQPSAKAGSRLMVDPRIPGSLLAALRDLQKQA